MNVEEQLRRRISDIGKRAEAAEKEWAEEKQRADENFASYERVKAKYSECVRERDAARDELERVKQAKDFPAGVFQDLEDARADLERAEAVLRGLCDAADKSAEIAGQVCGGVARQLDKARTYFKEVERG